MRQALAQHDELLSRAVAHWGGVVFKHTGDGMGASFADPGDAVSAAIAAQLALQSATWPEGDRLKVRMGVHLGDATPSGQDYFGPTVNRAARIMDVCNGDQIAVSSSVVEKIGGVGFVSMGAHQLRGIGTEEVSLIADSRLVRDDRPLRARVPVRGRQVPSAPARLIGRTDDLETAERLLQDCRLITITGPGGVGKTRFAQELALVASAEYAEPPAYCELASVDDEAGVAAVVAGALGARQQPELDMTESIVNYCSGRRVLLVVDNCEHVVGEVRRLVEQILSTAGPQVIATSRQPLAARVEQLLPLDPLPASSHGVDLFVTRAKERDPHFRIDQNERAIVTRICGHLDGIPAAIELAAARARILTPRQLLERLEQAFGGGEASDSGWLGTLHDTVRWSFDQLDGDEATVFARLSVFAGGFSLEAAEAVCFGEIDSDILDTLLALVDKSMVVPVRGGGRVRFRLLETMRAFGMDRLRESDTDATVRRRHAEYFAALATAESEALMTSKESEVWTQLREDWSNLRSAYEWLRGAGEVAPASELVVGLGWFATFGMHFEAFDWAAALLDDADDRTFPLRSALRGMRSLGAYFVADPAAQQLAEAAIAAEPNEASGLAHGALAAIYLNNLHALADSGQITEVWLTSVESAEDVSAANRLWAMALRIFHLTLNGDESAAVLAAEMTHRAQDSGSASAIALARWAEGLVLAAQRRPDEAEAVWKDGRDIAASLSSQHLLVHLINGLLAHWMAPRGEVVDVVAFCRRALDDAIAQHYLTGTSHLFGVTAIVLSRAGAAASGAALLGAMEGNGHVPRDPALPMLQSALGSEYDAAADVGRSWSVDEAGAFALDALDGLEAVDVRESVDALEAGPGDAV